MTDSVPTFPIVTGHHKDKTITRRRALAATDATATASATSTGSACMTLMTSVTEGPYYLDGAPVRKDITEGKSGVPLTLKAVKKADPTPRAPARAAAPAAARPRAARRPANRPPTLRPKAPLPPPRRPRKVRP